jgi:vacuolar protein sorting-associated protein 18
MDKDDANAWKAYLKKGKIEQALDNCQSSQRPYVAGIYADQLFQKKKYDEAAKYYAQSSKTFEEVSLKFIGESLFTNLIEYLLLMFKKILKKEQKDPDYKPQKQKLLICTWIVELKLNEINGIQVARDNETRHDKREDLNKRYQKKMVKLQEFLIETREKEADDTIFQVL